MTSSTTDSTARERGDLVAERHRRTVALTQELGVDHLLLGTTDNIRYATDYRSLLIQESSDHLLCLFAGSGEAVVFGSLVREVEQDPDPGLPHLTSLRPLAGWAPLHAEVDQAAAILVAELAAVGARRVGYDLMPPQLLQALQAGLDGVEFRSVAGDMFALRREKLPAEIALMRQAARENLDALEHAFAQARVGMTDREVLAAALAAQQRTGAESITHFTCNVQSGYDWFPAGRALTEGQPIFLDQVYYGPGGYASDLTRTAFVGEVPAPVADAYRRLVEVGEAVREAARPGVATWQLDELLAERLRRSGLGPSPYGLGHGIGLRVMEPPSLIDTVRTWTLRSGDTVALEPETSVEHDGVRTVVKVEDCFLVTDDGLSPLTTPAGPSPYRIG